MMLVIFYLAVGLFLAYVVFTFFEKSYSSKRLQHASTEAENLKFRKEEILAAISDLEYDFEMKKITEADYLQLKENLTQEAVQVMKKLDEIGEGAAGNEFISKRSEKIGS